LKNVLSAPMRRSSSKPSSFLELSSYTSSMEESLTLSTPNPPGDSGLTNEPRRSQPEMAKISKPPAMTKNAALKACERLRDNYQSDFCPWPDIGFQRIGVLLFDFSHLRLEGFVAPVYEVSGYCPVEHQPAGKRIFRKIFKTIGKHLFRLAILASRYQVMCQSQPQEHPESLVIPIDPYPYNISG